MKTKLNCVLLVDDDEPTNFLNEMVINQSGFAEKVVATQGGREALEYLKSMENGKHPQPDLILLDINMPAMNGWEFLEEYKKLSPAQQGKIVVIMLTTSLNPDDWDMAQKIDAINDFINKPLTVEALEEILNKHFSN